MSEQLVTDENPDEILSHVIHIEDYIASLEEALAVCHNTYNWQLMNATTDEESDKIKTVYTAHTTRVETRINEKVNIDIVVKKCSIPIIGNILFYITGTSFLPL